MRGNSYIFGIQLHLFRSSVHSLETTFISLDKGLASPPAVPHDISTGMGFLALSLSVG